MPLDHASILVSITLISLSDEVLETGSCPSCREPMNLHQPETGFPDRMLWTCEVCGSWFLMDLVPGRAEAVLVSLPDHGHFRSAVGR